jgi:hypothetical protein
MYIPIEVILMANPKILSIIKIMITLVGLIAIFLTINFYKCKWLRFVFISLGLTGLISLLLFMLSGSFCVFGLFGSVGLVLTLHCLVLRQIKDDLNGCIEVCPKPGPGPCPPRPCPDPCPPCPPGPCSDPCEPIKEPCSKFNNFVQKLGLIKPDVCPEKETYFACPEKETYFSEKCENENQTTKSNEVKFIESSVNTPCSSKYNKYYHKKSFYNNKCKNKYCKKCYKKEYVSCNKQEPVICDRDPNIFNEMFAI